MNMNYLGRFVVAALLALAAFAVVIPAADAAWVNGYLRGDGTYVGGFYRSNPNGLRYDNYSYRLGDPLYNQSYGRYSTPRWNTPSWSWQDDYWPGLHSYRSSRSNYGSYGSYGSYGRSSLYGSLLDDYEDDYGYDSYDYGDY